MADPRAALIEMADKDMRSVLRRLPKSEGANTAWVLTAVSHEAWQRFYPPLNSIPDDEPIVLRSIWRREMLDVSAAGHTPHLVPKWKLERWCVVRAANGMYIRITTFAVNAFGIAAAIEEIAPDDMYPIVSESIAGFMDDLTIE
jgi:hypothetical protein